MSRKLELLILSIGFVVALGLLVAANPIVLQHLPGGLPVGNVFAAFLFWMPAHAAMRVNQTQARYQGTSLSVVIIALCWLPVSIGLAGNLSLNFSGSRGALWLRGTSTLAIIVLGWLVYSLIARWRVGRNPGQQHNGNVTDER
ncbi:MAG: hypothetical protein AAAFM81_09215 [Pseudomonadota bacterium]